MIHSLIIIIYLEVTQLEIFSLSPVHSRKLCLKRCFPNDSRTGNIFSELSRMFPHCLERGRKRCFPITYQFFPNSLQTGGKQCFRTLQSVVRAPSPSSHGPHRSGARCCPLPDRRRQRPLPPPRQPVSTWRPGPVRECQRKLHFSPSPNLFSRLVPGAGDAETRFTSSRRTTEPCPCRANLGTRSGNSSWSFWASKAVRLLGLLGCVYPGPLNVSVWSEGRA